MAGCRGCWRYSNAFLLATGTTAARREPNKEKPMPFTRAPRRNDCHVHSTGTRSGSTGSRNGSSAATVERDR